MDNNSEIPQPAESQVTPPKVTRRGFLGRIAAFSAAVLGFGAGSVEARPEPSTVVKPQEVPSPQFFAENSAETKLDPASIESGTVARQNPPETVFPVTPGKS